MPRSAVVLAGAAYLLAACSGSPPPTAESHAGHTPGTSASPSASDAHTGHAPTDSGTPGTPHPSAHEGSDGSIVLETEFVPGGSGQSVADALAAAPSQPVLVDGVLLRDADGGIWVCDELGEGEPPACGRPRLWVTNFPSDELIFAEENARATGAQTEGGVTWIPDQQLFGVVHPAP
jgi:hypothetical protein